MLIDEKGRLFGKVNIVDLIVVAVIVLGVLGVAYKYVKSSSSLFKKTEDLQIVFYNEDLPKYVADSIKVGDKVKDSVKNTVFGEVASVETDNSVVFAPNDKGELTQTTRPGYVSMKLTVKGKGIYTDTGVIFNNTDYYVGRSLELRAGNGVIWTRVSEIKRASEQ
ncbi:MAG TPA: DUF4330 domain-containing protein [Clostridiales bacterium]|nr:DUF4330 domain-containing protein [Clostridiales bacterium]